MAILKPVPSSPIRALSGTRTPSRASSAVAWPRMPSLPWISVAANPAESVGTRNAEMPLGPGPPVRANSRTTSAHVPLVMNTFRPVSSQSSPSRSALVASDPASEPVSGSVSPKQPTSSPEHSPGSHRRRCSSVPCLEIVLPTRPSETEMMPRTAESPRAISSSTRQ